MSLIDVSLKHSLTLEEARTRLQQAVEQVTGNFSAMVNKVDWNATRDAVTIAGPGVEIKMSVDATTVHISGDMPMLSKLLGGPLKAGLKSIVENAFQKRLK